MPSSPPHSQGGHFHQPIKTHNKKIKDWNAEWCGTTKCKWSQAMTRNTPQPQQKKSFILFHITVIQCPAVASIHDYISTKGGGGGGEEGNAW